MASTLIPFYEGNVVATSTWPWSQLASHLWLFQTAFGIVVVATMLPRGRGL
ncbi:uncharacterized protein G2W53_027203 [Senna tora]|uniref:Uncharacterized protein n=1 Tax=Senna tora TaxID=362788 RepID=A0A834WI70_9FABA|nr:uncharacterized protein G2W53_027203 [Senna tora]